MRIAIAFLLVATLSACSKLSPEAASAKSKSAFESCVTASDDLTAQMDAAMSMAESPTYAAETKAAAETCAQTRRDLKSLDTNHPCLPLVELYESYNWALTATFEGRGTMDDHNPIIPTRNDHIACARANGATAEELASMEPTAEELEFERQADAALADAHRASREAMEAAARVR